MTRRNPTNPQFAMISSIEERGCNGYTIAAAAAGDLVLQLNIVSDFDVDGGDLTLNDVGLEYVSIDNAAQTITLKAELGFDVADRTSVYPDPLEVRMVANVLTVGSLVTEEAIVPSGHLWQDTRLKPGQTVLVQRAPGRTGQLRVLEIPGSAPAPDGKYTAPGTLQLSLATDLDEFQAQNFGAEMSRATDYFGVNFTGAVFQTRVDDGTGSRIALDGFRNAIVASRDGKTVIWIDGVSNYFAGIINAESVSVANALEIWDEVELGPGAVLRLLSSVTAPGVPPTVAATWQQQQVYPQPGPGPVSLAYSGGSFYFVKTISGGGTPRLKLFSAVDSPYPVESHTEFSVVLAANTLGHGLVRLAGAWWVLVTTSGGAFEVRKYDGAGTMLGHFPISVGTSPCLGTDGTDLLVCAWSLTGYLIQHYSTSGVAGTLVTTDTVYGTPNSILGGNFDFGSYRYVIRENITSPVIDVYDSSGVEQPTQGWDDAAKLSAKTPADLCWDGSAFREMASDGTVYAYTNMLTGTYGTPTTVTVGTTWADASHETDLNLSATSAVLTGPRQQLNVAVSGIPAGADRADVYATATASPVRTDFWRQHTPASGDSSWTLTALLTSGTNPPASSTFAAGTAAKVKGVTDIFYASYSNAHDVDYRLTALEAGGGGGGGGTGGIGGVGGGHWGDTYGAMGVGGGHWGDTYG